MKTRLNLRRSPRTYILFGALLVLIGAAMLLGPDPAVEQQVLGLVFGMCGLLAAGYVDWLVVDRQANELVRRRGLVIPFHNTRYPLDRIGAVKVSVKTVRRGNRREFTTYPIELNGIKGAVVSNHRDPWFSRVVAEQLARRLGVPLVNDVYGKTTTRAPDEVDLPLVERWIRNRTRFDPPARPPGSGLRETARGSSYELSMRAELPILKYVVPMLFALGLPAVVEVPAAAFFHSAFYRCFAGVLALLGVMLLAFCGRSHLRITDREISFRQGWFPIRHRLPIAAIEEMIVAGEGIALVGDARAVWLHWAGSKADSQYLEAVVPYQLLRLARNAASSAETA